MVNGTRCEVSVSKECLRWWRTTNRTNNRTTGELRHDKTLRQIAFSQIVAIKRPPALTTEVIDELACKTNNKRKLTTICDKKLNKIKVYYAKQNRNKAAGKLLKLAKLSIEPTHHHLFQSSTTATTASETEGETTETEVTISTCPLDELAEQLVRELDLRRRQRPKRLLVFANPFGGKGKAVQLFKKQVRRLLDLAEIEAKLVITKYANHARETIEDPQFNVEHFDGIVCVGGDGMFSELMNGLLFRYNRDRILLAQLNKEKLGEISGGGGGGNASEVRSASPVISETGSLSNQSNINDNNNGKRGDGEICSPAQQQTNPTDDRRLAQLRLALGGIGKQFMSPPIPVGVIGAGSTDANSFGLIGTNDVITATLNIILGNQIKIDVCSIHSHREDRVLRFVSTFVAYGYFGDVIRESEKLRWLGPSRYDVTGVNNLIKNRTYRGTVNILVSSKDGSPRDDTERCHTDCKQCRLTTSHEYNNQDAVAITRQQQEMLREQQLVSEQSNHDDLKILERRGAFIGVNAAVTACRCPQTKKGFSPNNHLANGCADLILVRPCTRMQYVQYLLRTGWTKMSAFDLKYVEAFRCRQFEFVVDEKGRMEKETSASLSTSSTSYSSSSSSSSSSVDDGLASSLDSNQSSQLASGLIGDTFSSWNVDGELLNVQSIRVKINNQLLRVFGTGEPHKI